MLNFLGLYRILKEMNIECFCSNQHLHNTERMTFQWGVISLSCPNHTGTCTNYSIISQGLKRTKKKFLLPSTGVSAAEPSRRRRVTHLSKAWAPVWCKQGLDQWLKWSVPWYFSQSSFENDWNKTTQQSITNHSCYMSDSITKHPP